MDLQDLYRRAIHLSTSPSKTKYLAPLLLCAEAVLCTLIIWKVPYTEIDFETYMHQVSLYLKGERDYTAIKGPTGPLVYPAAHVYIYSALYWLTDGGEDQLRGQIIFAGIYMGCLALVFQVYRASKAPPYLFPLLILSKRLHSIFLLRLFNDCFAVGALFAAVYAYQRRMWTVGSVIYSWGIGIKMSLLVGLPGVAMVLGQAMPVSGALRIVLIMVLLQVVLAFPFLSANDMGYVSRAFEFSRQFLYKWTVNWRFVPEEQFLSKEFSLGLASVHIALLVAFVTTRWTRPSGLSIPELVHRVFKPLPDVLEQQMSIRVTPAFVSTTILSSVAIGMLCARSLHYQFYSYIAWSTPLLLWKSNFHPILIYAIWATQEWAWNVYPSTKASSMIVVACLASQVIGVWDGTGSEHAGPTNSTKTKEKRAEHME
ncbi:MAG: dolichyl-P-Man:Man(5)GlcNAc(2)-PP-dolichol alpha-1,3-mannosyltransferase [Icmadophila ericetorum]|nr:dolichyl-P-Man:Man(5)GlcNAc(2)-PP-dolichol alpha-1,3-mannosyltransferase [Icmadophila ericetorum]